MLFRSNARLNKLWSQRKEVLWVEKSEKKAANEAQGYWLHEGLILIVYLPSGVKRGCHNGQLLEVQGLPQEGMVPLRDIESKEEMAQPLEFVRDYMRLGYAFTGCGAQGRSLGNFATEDEPERGLTVWTKHFNFSWKHLFTGCSRCRSSDLLQVA